MNTFKVQYAFRFSDSIEINANTKEEAESKVKDMIVAGKLGNPNEMWMDEIKVWTEET